MRLAFASVLVLAIVAPVAADDIRDNYKHNTAVTINLTKPSKVSTQDTSKGTLKVREKSPGDLVFTWTEEGYKCRLTAKLNGDAISFGKNQSCSFVDDDSDMVMTMVLVSGSGSVDDDDELDLKMSWKLSGTMAGAAIAGTASQRTTAIPM